MQERGYEDGHFVNVTISHPVQIVDFLFSFLQEAVRFEYIYKKKNPPKNSEILYLRVAITFNLQKSQMPHTVLRKWHNCSQIAFHSHQAVRNTCQTIQSN